MWGTHFIWSKTEESTELSMLHMVENWYRGLVKSLITFRLVDSFKSVGFKNFQPYDASLASLRCGQRLYHNLFSWYLKTRTRQSYMRVSTIFYIMRLLSENRFASILTVCCEEAFDMITLQFILETTLWSTTCHDMTMPHTK